MKNSSEIIFEVACKHKIPLHVLKGSRTGATRSPDQIFAVRSEACYRLRTERKLSYPKIARLMGYDDHTSVMYAVERFNGSPISAEPPKGRRSLSPRQKNCLMAERINEFWAERGKQANARVVTIRDGEYRIESDLRLSV